MSFEIEQKVGILRKSNESKLSNDEAAVILACREKAKVLLDYLAGFKIEDSKKTSRLSKGIFKFKKARMAVAVAFEDKKLREFRDALDGLVGLATLQILTRMENSMGRVEDNNLTLIDVVKTIQISVTAPLGDPRNNGGRETNPVFLVPYTRNSAFVGRDETFEKLDTQFTATQSAQQVQKAAIYGLGGTCKTQSALEYAHRLRDEMTVIWVYTAKTARFEQDFKSIAD